MPSSPLAPSLPTQSPHRAPRTGGVLDQDRNHGLGQLVGDREFLLELARGIAFLREEDRQHVGMGEGLDDGFAPVGAAFDIGVVPDAYAPRLEPTHNRRHELPVGASVADEDIVFG